MRHARETLSRTRTRSDPIEQFSAEAHGDLRPVPPRHYRPPRHAFRNRGSISDPLAETGSEPCVLGDHERVAVKAIDERGNGLLVVKDASEALGD